jgi:hypothetical protein
MKTKMHVFKENYERIFGHGQPGDKSNLPTINEGFGPLEGETSTKLDFVVDSKSKWGEYGGVTVGVKLVPVKSPQQVVKAKLGDMRVNPQEEKNLEKEFRKISGFDWYVSNREFNEHQKNGWRYILSINPTKTHGDESVIKSGEFDKAEKKFKGKKFKLHVVVKPKN